MAKLNHEPPSYDHMKEQTIALQRARLETYEELRRQNLPVPSDLRAEIEGDKQCGGGCSCKNPQGKAGGVLNEIFRIFGE